MFRSRSTMKKIRVSSTELLFRLRIRQERESEDWWRARRRHADVHFRGDARFRLRAVLKHRKRASTATTRSLPCFRRGHVIAHKPGWLFPDGSANHESAGTSLFVLWSPRWWNGQPAGIFETFFVIVGGSSRIFHLDGLLY